MRSSSRRICFASFAVSVSPTVSASVSIARYVAISSCSSENSVFAFLSCFSASPLPRSACSGPFAAGTTLLAMPVVTLAIAPGPPSFLSRRSTSLACCLVSFRCSCSRFL